MSINEAYFALMGGPAAFQTGTLTIRVAFSATKNQTCESLMTISFQFLQCEIILYFVSISMWVSCA